jgi:hypothetical protein
MALEPAQREPAERSTAALRRGGDARALENLRRHDAIDFVRRRSLLFDLRELRGPAWVEGDGTISAIFYDDQIAALSSDEPGTFRSSRAGRTAVPVRRTGEAAVAWDRSTGCIRFRASEGGPHAVADAGEVGWVEFARKPRDVLTVPASAVLQSSQGPYVLAASDDLTFEKRPIEVGETFAGLGVVVVLAGLQAQDRVVARGALFVDAERMQRAQAGGAGGVP